MSRIIAHLYELLIKIKLASCLNSLADLQHVYFTCYSYRDYFSKQTQYEKTLYQKRSKWLSRMLSVRRLLKDKKNSEKWHSIFTRIDYLSEIIFALHQLRFREREYAIFEICSLEIQALDRAIAAAMKDAIKKILWNKNLSHPVELLDSIIAFEAISHRVLKVTSSEPIIFLFFIQNLYALDDEINKIYEKLY